MFNFQKVLLIAFFMIISFVGMLVIISLGGCGAAVEAAPSANGCTDHGASYSTSYAGH